MKYLVTRVIKTNKRMKIGRQQKNRKHSKMKIVVEINNYHLLKLSTWT